jgi:spore coat protein A
MDMNRPEIYDFMQFRVVLPRKSVGTSFSLPQQTAFTPLHEAGSVRTRDFILTERTDNQGRSTGVRINDKGYDDPVTETVKLNSLEKWRFLNTTDDAHPMHLHLVQFQILERQGFDGPALQKGTVKLLGTPRKPETNEAGWKDTAVVNPGDALTILVRFEGYTGRYVFHCHMLEHEDNDMMRPYEVVPEDAESSKAETASAAATLTPKTLSLQSNMPCRLKFATIQCPAPQNPAAGSAMIVADPALPDQ